MSLKRDEDYDSDADAATSNKKSRLVEQQQAQIDDIDPLAIDCILGYLDVKSLYRFAFCSKHFSEVVTHEHVVRSAMISGGHANKTMSDVIDLALNKRNIFLPSPSRLLRLANGKCCENKLCTALVHHIRPGYGLFFCWDCLTGSTIAIKNSHKMLKNDRVARGEYSRKSYLLKRPYTDTAGERAGPIISYANQESSQDDIQNLLEEADETVSQERSASILKCLEQAAEDRRKLEYQASNAKHGRRIAKKEKVLQLAVTLKEMLSASASCTHYNDTLCSYREYHCSKANQPFLRFRCKFVDNKMKDFVVAPSKATKKKLKEVVNYIEETMEVVVESGFLDFSFLESDATVNVWESKLQEELRTHYSDVLMRVNDSMLNLIQQGRLSYALNELEDNPPQTRLRYEVQGIYAMTGWGGLFADIVMIKFADSIPPSLDNSYARGLAVFVYIDKRRRETKLDFSMYCDEASKRFRSMLPAAAEFVYFVKHEKAKKIHDPTPERQAQYTEANIDRWKRFGDHGLEMLEKRQFEDLLLPDEFRYM